MTKTILFAAAARGRARFLHGRRRQGAPAGDAAKGAPEEPDVPGCHGIEGWRTAFPEVYRVPRIGGQHEA